MRTVPPWTRKESWDSSVSFGVESKAKAEVRMSAWVTVVRWLTHGPLNSYSVFTRYVRL